MRLLVAEDDISLSRGIEMVLKKNHYVVDTVADGKAAIDYLESGIYDCAILDIMMPKADGITVLNAIRKQKNPIPVLILSARSEIEDKVNGLNAGANDYLTKPFDMRELLARINALLRTAEERQEPILQAGNVSLDLRTCSLSTPYGSYRLVCKEFQMMRYFMQNMNCVISPETFLDKIWTSDNGGGTNTVWTYVSYLRRKLEALQANVQISTKRNLGYILEVIK